MIFIDELYNMKLYKRPFYLPLDNKNKRKGSAVMLLTPNYESSRNLMNHKLITGKYYNSYYLDKDVSLLIKDDKSLVKEDVLLEKSKDNHFNNADSVKRSVMLQSRKGIYQANKIKKNLDRTTDPLQTNPDPDTVEKARKDNPEDDDLQKINVPTLDIQIPTPSIGSGGFSTGNKKVAESCFIFNNKDIEINESYIRSGNKVIFLNEDLVSDTSIKKAIYGERLKNNREIFTIYNQVKLDNPDIKYTYLTLDKYKTNNIYVDLFYYNETYFKNAIYKNNKGFTIYDSLMSRLINDKKLIDAGYTNRYILVPVTDWSTDTKSRPWMYKDEITPMTILYHNAEKNLTEFKKKYKDNIFVFISNNAYFKLEVNTFETKHLAMFKRFLTALKNNDYVEGSRDDNTDSSKVIAMKIIDKIETSKNIEIHNLTGTSNKDSGSTLISANDKDEANKISAKKTPELVIAKSIEGPSKTDKEELIDSINSIASNSDSVEDAMKILDNDDYLKNIIINLDAEEDNTVKISAARAARFNKLNNDLMKQELNGKTIEQILNAESVKELPSTSLDIDTVNEDWKDLKFINMSKTYDLDKDIVSILYDLQNKSTPIYIRNITTSDNSTSEDWLTTYKVEMEDVNGKRFTIKFDIPIVKDNFMMLRSNRKTISNQLFLMPIIKTEEDTVQIVSNYNKIFVRRFGTLPGKTHPGADIIIKSLNKQNYNDIRVITADNSKICSKYELPIDYIDLASQFDSIEYTIDKVKYKIYFNQDKLRREYGDKIDINKEGFPYGVSSKGEILYYTANIYFSTFSKLLLYNLCTASSTFAEVSNAQHTSSKYCYSKMSILSTDIPLIVVAGYTEGLKKVLDKSTIEWHIVEKKKRNDLEYDYIKFNDGFIRYRMDYSSSLLMNGLKECPTESYSIGQMNDKSMWLDFLDLFGGRIKGDGLDNFADLMIDPITKEVLKHYNLPTDYVTILLYANNLLVDNKFIKHTQMEGRRIRKNEIIAGYFYKALSESYKDYQIQLKHGRQTTMTMKQSIVIDKIMADPTESDASILNALIDAEYNYAVSTKGLSGMNSDRSYSLDKRTFDDSMLNVLGMSTGFAGNVGITRQATIDTNVEGSRGYVKVSNDPNKISTTKTYCFTEALVPFGTTRDDPFRTAMTFIQTSKHNVRVNHSSPMLITNGSDEALPYMISNTFAYKAKKKGKVVEKNDRFMIIQYNDNTADYIDLTEKVEKNSNGGFFIPIKLDSDFKVGQSVKEGQIVAYDKLSFSPEVGATDNIGYCSGTLIKCALLTTDEGFEDSAIISDKLSHDLASDVIIKKEIFLPKNTNIYNVVKEGSHIEEGEPLMIMQTPYDEDDTNQLLKSLAADEDEISDLGRVAIHSKVTGIVQKVKVYRTVDKSELSDSLRKLCNQLESNTSESRKVMKQYGIEDNYDLDPDYKLDPVGKLKNCQDGVLIEFYLKYNDKFKVGETFQ